LVEGKRGSQVVPFPCGTSGGRHIVGENEHNLPTGTRSDWESKRVSPSGRTKGKRKETGMRLTTSFGGGAYGNRRSCLVYVCLDGRALVFHREKNRVTSGNPRKALNSRTKQRKRRKERRHYPGEFKGGGEGKEFGLFLWVWQGKNWDLLGGGITWVWGLHTNLKIGKIRG